MKTLVIHPFDRTTDFLGVIYKNTDWTIMRDPKMSKSKLRKAIISHDRIVMLGHGTEDGMGDMINGRFLIDSNMVQFLREKDCVCIWCNADKFVGKYKLTGFYTGMIVSDYEEAMMFCFHHASREQIDFSNGLFADSVRESIQSDDMLNVMVEKYDGENNPVIDFNKQNLYTR